MAGITITYPKPGASRVDPNTLKRKVIAHGTKDATQIPLGVLLSVDGANATDKRYRIGGKTLLARVGTAGDKKCERWVIAFDIPPQVRPRDRFTLAVFDTAGLPAAQAAAATTTVQHLSFDAGTKKRRGKGSDAGATDEDRKSVV